MLFQIRHYVICGTYALAAVTFSTNPDERRAADLNNCSANPEEPGNDRLPRRAEEPHGELIPEISDESHGELIPRIADELNEKIGELVGETC